MVELSDIDKFSNYTQVSRETILSLIKFEKKLKYSNKKINLIGKSTANFIWNRHFLDSAQVIDYIEENTNKIIDLGSGAGFPGIVLGLLAKDRKMPFKIELIEKSPRKANFLREIIRDFNLKASVIEENIFNYHRKLSTDLIIARAFKPLGVILDFLNKNLIDWKKVILFLGKSGKDELLQASKIWDLKYKQRVSVTSNDSLVIEINEIKRKAN